MSRTMNDDEVDCPAGQCIVEHAGHETAGSPRPRVEIGPALIQFRSLSKRVVSMHDMTAFKTRDIPFGIAFPEQRGFGLSIARDAGIEPCVNINPVCIDMHER